jgi:uncharacterized protein YpmS
MRQKKWKVLFFTLLGINLGLIGLFLILITASSSETKIPQEDEGKGENVVPFSVQTNKSDLNQIIDHYMKELSQKGPVNYQVNLEDEVQVYGQIKVFTQDLELMLTLEPEALKNGNLLLTPNHISIGKLSLPVEFVLKFMKAQYHIPEWITIQPNEGNIYVSLQELRLKNNLRVKADRFDLKNDDIRFTLFVPVD